jgi:hypothetical protein
MNNKIMKQNIKLNIINDNLYLTNTALLMGSIRKDIIF